MNLLIFINTVLSDRLSSHGGIPYHGYSVPISARCSIPSNHRLECVSICTRRACFPTKDVSLLITMQ